MRDHRGPFGFGERNVEHRTFNVEYLAIVCKRVFSWQCGEVKPCYNHSMSRKQEIYREMLMFALALTRNTLSDFHSPRRGRFLSFAQQQDLRSSYEIAQFSA